MVRITAFVLLAVLAAVAYPAGADEIDILPSEIFDAPSGQPAAEDDTDAQAKLSATYCDRYGPGYTLVPGTTTCIKASGYWSIDLYSRSRKR